MKNKFLKVTFACFAIMSSNSHATLIDFSGLSSSQGNTSYTEDGFNFNALSGDFSTYDNANTPNSGFGPALIVDHAAQASVSLTKADGGNFDLLSFWGAEGRNNDTGYFATYGSTHIDITGYFGTGGSITWTTNLDLQALNNSSTDFEFFSLSGFTALTRVTFTGGNESTAFDGFSFNLDQINLSATQVQVPEPTTLVIFALGLIGLASRRIKKHS